MDSRRNRRNKAAFSNSFGFRVVLLCTVSLTVEIKAAFSNSFGFRDVLLWTVNLTVQIKLRFQIPSVFVT